MGGGSTVSTPGGATHDVSSLSHLLQDMCCHRHLEWFWLWLGVATFMVCSNAYIMLYVPCRPLQLHYCSWRSVIWNHCHLEMLPLLCRENFSRTYMRAQHLSRACTIPASTFLAYKYVTNAQWGFLPMIGTLECFRVPNLGKRISPSAVFVTADKCLSARRV